MYNYNILVQQDDKSISAATSFNCCLTQHGPEKQLICTCKHLIGLCQVYMLFVYLLALHIKGSTHTQIANY